MMTQMNIKIDSDLKQEVDYICQQLGISITDAIRIFLNKVKFERGIPFEMKLNYEPNEETKQALNSKDFIELDSVEELWSQYEKN